ncbi:hypothetical protein HY483_01470 [Candidatus Woesearchaeota archaeon]|nr:hypothetical protein [Candidatus Woesearchaeota archaeon]
MVKLSKKIVEDVAVEVAGEEVLPLVRSIQKKSNISEFLIAKSIKMEINPTRNLLYKLYNANLVTYNRKKDKVKGWYVYYWTFNPQRAKFLFHDLKKRKIQKLEERLTRERKGFYYNCSNNCIRLDFERATEFEYKCPECGNILCEDDNKKRIEFIEREILNLRKEMQTN